MEIDVKKDEHRDRWIDKYNTNLKVDKPFAIDK